MKSSQFVAIQQFLRMLDDKAPINPYAVAFLLTESSFRGPLFRLIEFCYSAWLIYLVRREPRVTLGHSQVSFPFWRLRYGNNHLSLLLATWSEIENYEICCMYLRSRDICSIKEMLIFYNGKPSKLYAERFLENLALVKSTILRMRLQSIDPLYPAFRP